VYWGKEELGLGVSLTGFEAVYSGDSNHDYIVYVQIRYNFSREVVLESSSTRSNRRALGNLFIYIKR